MKKEEYSVHKNDRESEFYIFEEGVVVFWNVSIEDVRAYQKNWLYLSSLCSFIYLACAIVART